MVYLGHGADIRHVPGLTGFTEWTHQIISSAVADFLTDRHRDENVSHRFTGHQRSDDK